MDVRSVLEDMGLTPAETSVYLTLLDVGETLAGPIIKKTGLHRGTAYQVLQRLMEKGLVSSVVRDKKRHFSPVDPKHFLEILKQKEEDMQDVLPNLLARVSASKHKQEVTVFSGAKGIRTALERMLAELNPSGRYDDFGVSGLFKKVLPAYWGTWQRQKKKAGIVSRIIINADFIGKTPTFLKDYVGEARLHPPEYRSITDTMIFNDTVMLLIWTANPSLAVVITNADNAQSYRNQFELMWKQSKAVK
ncbi:MAG: helix-turn-helix domain-containing protein [archaeon]